MLIAWLKSCWRSLSHRTLRWWNSCPELNHDLILWSSERLFQAETGETEIEVNAVKPAHKVPKAKKAKPEKRVSKAKPERSAPLGRKVKRA